VLVFLKNTYLFTYVRTDVRIQKSVHCASRQRGFERVCSQRDLTPCDCRQNRRYRVIVFASSLSKDHRTQHSPLSPLATQALGFQSSCSHGASVTRPVVITFLFATAIASSGSRLWLPTLPPPFFWVWCSWVFVFFLPCWDLVSPQVSSATWGLKLCRPLSISVSCVFFFALEFFLCRLWLRGSSRRLPILVFSGVLWHT
jgi:hypothetical protein